MHMLASVPWCACGGQKTTWWSWVSPFTSTWLPEIKLRALGLRGKCLYPLSCPAVPAPKFLTLWTQINFFSFNLIILGNLIKVTKNWLLTTPPHPHTLHAPLTCPFWTSFSITTVWLSLEPCRVAATHDATFPDWHFSFSNVYWILFHVSSLFDQSFLFYH